MIKHYGRGSLVYFDTIAAGLVPAKVLSVTSKTITIKFTATRRAFKRGATWEANVKHRSIVPRGNVKWRKHGAVIVGDWRWIES